MKTTHTATMGRRSVVLDVWSDRRIGLVLQALLLIGCSALAAFGKSVHPSMGIPGSSAMFWLPALVVGRSAVKRDGAGLAMGVMVAAWGLPFGLNHSFGYNVCLYGIAGGLLDVSARIPGIKIQHVLGAMACGLMAHMAKFGVIVFEASMASVTKHFLIVGLLKSAGLHAGFGVASGLIGWGVVKVGSKMSRRLP